MNYNFSSTEFNNKLIAQFMGFKYHEQADFDDSECGGIYTRKDVYSKVPIQIDKYPDQHYLKSDWRPEIGSYIVGKLQYHISWDWLMPVVEKIDSLGFYTYIFHDEDLQQANVWSVPVENRKDFDAIVQNRPGHTTIKFEAIYEMVVDFIKWYNNLNNDPEFLLHLIDVTSTYVMEKNHFLATPTREELIKKAKFTFKKSGSNNPINILD